MPPSGKSPVRVGPEDLDSAGDLVAGLGVHNKGNRIIKAVAARYPQELVTAQMREEDPDRSAHLDEGETLTLARENFGGRKAVEAVESARVKGAKGPEEDMSVVLLLRGKSGRTWRNLLPYENFTQSRKAYQDALEAGEVGTADKRDPDALLERIARLEGELSAERGARREEEEAGSSSADLVDGTTDEVKDRIGGYDDDQLADALTAEHAGKDRKGVVEAIEAEQQARAEKAAESNAS